YTVTMTAQGVNAQKQPWSVNIPLHSYAMQAIVSPRDAATGQASGKRMHKPMVITMQTDKATPLLQHLTPNEEITSFTLKFTPAVPNAASHTLVIKTIANARHLTSNGLVEVGFTFQKINWTWVEGGKTTTDDWEAPNV